MDEDMQEEVEASNFEAKRGSEIMRIMQDQGSLMPEDMTPKKQIKILNGEYKLLDVIGEGSFGTVYEAKCNRTGKLVAIKKFKNKFSS